MIRKIKPLLLLILLLAFMMPAQAVLFNFLQVTSNGEAPVAHQLKMDVTNPGSGNILFTFSNIGSTASNIANIFIDDDPSTPFLNSLVSILDNPWTGGNPAPAIPNVEFQDASGQANFGTSVTGFVDTFHFKSAPPSSKAGINPSESLGLLFSLSAGKTFQNTIDSLLLNGDDNLRFGLHVTSIAGLGSEKYINTGGNTPDEFPVVPEPNTMILLGSGLGYLAMLRRKRKA